MFAFVLLDEAHVNPCPRYVHVRRDIPPAPPFIKFRFSIRYINLKRRSWSGRWGTRYSMKMALGIIP